ncbi:MAG TPA: hypothetical protein DIT10_11235 [Chryseobacterium sp.]|nr:hypothetical protein [Chryseobacterium sp.]
MKLEDKILEIINVIESKHLNDPTKSDDYDEITNLLLSDVNQTIHVIENLNLDNLEHISSDFEELSYKFQSKEFVECLKKLEEKYPKKMSPEIQKGIEAYYGD